MRVVEWPRSSFKMRPTPPQVLGSSGGWLPRLAILDTDALGHGAYVRIAMLPAWMATPCAAHGHGIDSPGRLSLHRERGLAMATVSGRPPTSWPSSAPIALFASSGVDISTKPKPRELPLCRSVTTVASVTSPCRPNSVWRSAEVVAKARLPTWSLLNTIGSFRACESILCGVAAPAIRVRSSQYRLHRERMGESGRFDEDGTFPVGDLDTAKPSGDDPSVPGRDHTKGSPLE